MCVLGVGWDKYMCVCWGWGGISNSYNMATRAINQSSARGAML